MDFRFTTSHVHTCLRARDSFAFLKKPVNIVLHLSPNKYRILGPPRLVCVETEEGTIGDLRALLVLPGLAELLKPQKDPPLQLGDLMCIQAMPPLRQWYQYYKERFAVLNASEFKNGPILLHAHLPSLVRRGCPREEMGSVYSLYLMVFPPSGIVLTQLLSAY